MNERDIKRIDEAYINNKCNIDIEDMEGVKEYLEELYGYKLREERVDIDRTLSVFRYYYQDSLKIVIYN